MNHRQKNTPTDKEVELEFEVGVEMEMEVGGDVLRFLTNYLAALDRNHPGVFIVPLP